ncbi:MAG: type IX secretion system membrane protein PorP/SprF [Bacteroidales bacterium]|jgi:type IX secretion system PorP/SprF family membrane protein|nr:type IX secretion system membrane protein PorP/SprF [Bacteroidales bacterium]MDD4672402.1 type IX secretion system membrane protein PorP/SprF [Bacteroidales bacterium]MDY0347475.1 type IX secretion system membrane protein PorP/SprF [Tenuifilaceae bacterium]
MRKLFVSIIMLFAISVSAQQDPLLSHNIFNQITINPASAGSSGMICATAIHRQQWMNFGEGSPVVSAVNLDAAISPFGFSSGIGLNVLQDQFGFNTDVGASLSYAARFTIKGVGKLAIGVNGGFINNSLEPDWKFPEGGSTGTSNLVPQQSESGINFDMGAGIYFHSDEMFFGLSATHLNETSYYNKYSSHYKRHYYITGGYFLKLPNQNWQINPSVLISSDLATSHLGFGANFVYNKKFWGGVSYRIGESVTGLIGIELFSGMRVGYAYDFSTTSISGLNSGGSHEFMVGYCFSLKKERAPQQYKSIRFL